MLKRLKFAAIKFWFNWGGLVIPHFTAFSAYLLFTKPVRRFPKEGDKALLNNARVVKEIFENQKIHGYSLGSGEKLVLLFHGWNTHALSMRNFVLPLLEKGFKVMLFDAPSHGYSDGGRGSAPVYRRFIELILAKYKPYAIIAHSLAGTCTLSAIAHNKNLAVDKVAILSSPSSSLTVINQFIQLSGLHSKAHAHFWDYVKAQMKLDPAEFNLPTIFPDGIKLNGLIIHDLYDETIPYADALELSKLWPSAKLISTKNLGHSGVLKDPLIVEQVVTFVEKSE